MKLTMTIMIVRLVWHSVCVDCCQAVLVLDLDLELVVDGGWSP